MSPLGVVCTLLIAGGEDRRSRNGDDDEEEDPIDVTKSRCSLDVTMSGGVSAEVDGGTVTHCGASLGPVGGVVQSHKFEI